jgi:2-C-methyl-D-erythritol 4-phosphate cytidylyltransferase
MKKPRFAGLIVAGGKGKRMHRATPKQFITLDGIPMFIHALLPFEQDPRIDTVVLVLPRKYHSKGRRLLKRYNIRKAVALAPAGKTRQLSVHHGLSVLNKWKPDLVVIHDAARPLVTRQLIDRVCDEAERSKAASAAIEIRDTIIRKHNGSMVERDDLLKVQTPQAFDFSLLCRGHTQARKKGKEDYPDDATLLRACGVKTTLVEGDVTNLKITTRGDLLLAELVLGSR